MIIITKFPLPPTNLSRDLSEQLATSGSCLVSWHLIKVRLEGQREREVTFCLIYYWARFI